MESAIVSDSFCGSIGTEFPVGSGRLVWYLGGLRGLTEPGGF